MLTSSQFQVLLVAGIDAIGLGRMPFLLHQAGCRITLLAPSGIAIVKSRYVSHHIPTSHVPQQRAVDIKNLLQTQNSAFAAVIIGDEPTLLALAEYRGQDWLDGWFPLDHRSEALDIALNKLHFYSAAVNAGIRMPFSSQCQNWSEVERAVKLATYPVMLKGGTGMSGSGVYKVHDDAELEAAHAGLRGAGQDILVQHFYHGPVGSTDVLFNHGVPLCWQSSYSRQCWPTPLASSSAREIMQHPDFAEIVVKVGQISGFHGFAGIDWIYDTESDHIYVLELNPRPTPSYHMDRYSGVSFSRSFQQMLAGQAQTTPPPPVAQPAPFIRLFPQNLYWAISARSLRSFLLCWRDAPWHDFKLLLAYLRRLLTHYLPTQWRQFLRKQAA